MFLRDFCIRAVSATVIGVSLCGAAGAAQVGSGTYAMFPILAYSHITSPDHSFITKASNLAIATLGSSSAMIADSRSGSVQGEAVRAFNTAAEAYNRLTDIASERGMKVADAPNAIYDPAQSPTPVDGTPIRAEEIAYVSARQTSLMKTIGFYRDEIAHGKDRAVVAFAQSMADRLEHDLTLATININGMSTGSYGDLPARS